MTLVLSPPLLFADKAEEVLLIADGVGLGLRFLSCKKASRN